jgi:hypothetical protein
MRIIASIEDPQVIDKILRHVQSNESGSPAGGPPAQEDGLEGFAQLGECAVYRDEFGGQFAWRGDKNHECD